jgi:hypothetical protein
MWLHEIEHMHMTTMTTTWLNNVGLNNDNVVPRRRTMMMWLKTVGTSTVRLGSQSLSVVL